MGTILANRAHAGPLALASDPLELELLAETRDFEPKQKSFFLKPLEVFDMFFFQFRVMAG
jgi:hypothetical protein